MHYTTSSSVAFLTSWSICFVNWVSTVDPYKQLWGLYDFFLISTIWLTVEYGIPQIFFFPVRTQIFIPVRETYTNSFLSMRWMWNGNCILGEKRMGQSEDVSSVHRLKIDLLLINLFSKILLYLGKFALNRHCFQF